MLRRTFFVFLTAFILLGGTLPAAAAPDTKQAKDFVQNGINDAFDVLRDQDRSHTEKSDRLRALLRIHFDVPTIGKFVLGVHRRKASEEQLEAYFKVFEDFLVQVYINRIVSYTPEKDAEAGNIFQVTGTRPGSKTDVFVLSELRRATTEPEPIEWRVRDARGRLAVIDVSIQGTSQLLTYKQEFASVIRRRGSGIDGLIAELQEKNEKFRTDDTTTTQ